MEDKKQTRRALLVPADPNSPVQEIDLPSNDREAVNLLCDLVGGNIESVPTGRSDVSAFINDVGKYEGLPPNVRATKRLITPDFLPGDYIAGNCVFAGLASTGDTVDLPEDEVIA